MTIDEAINLLEFIQRTLLVTLSEGEKDAIKLGIEALNILKGFRIWGETSGLWHIPGETEK